jgi:two-component system response regulator AlgR
LDLSLNSLEAERDYMRLHVGTCSYLLHQTIASFETRLDPAKFMRVHRSAILHRRRGGEAA